MLTALLAAAFRLLLSLRYRVRVTGIAEVASKGTRGILFLPNHPALIDPPILLSRLIGRFAPHTLADKDQIRRPGIHWLAQRVGVFPIPDVALHGEASRSEVDRALGQCIEALQRGDNVLLYPAGHIARRAREDLGAASAAATILKAVPKARVVLIRTGGLWGSVWSYAQGRPPTVARALRHGALSLLANGILFTPRRTVTVALHEPADLPRATDRAALNRTLEAFYNHDPAPNTYVPYAFWEKGGTRTMPEPTAAGLGGDPGQVPAGTRALVLQRLAAVTGCRSDALQDGKHLARDLGLDSLALLDLALWLEAEFGFAIERAADLATVGDVLLAACGTVVAPGLAELKPVPPAWLRTGRRAPELALPSGETVPAVFLAQARRGPGRLILADQNSGTRTYRGIITALHVLLPRIEALPGDQVGVMLPASVGAAVATLAVLFAGRTAVMVNWTVGPRYLVHCLTLTGVQRILTARRLVQRLESQGTSFAQIKDRFVYLEDLGKAVRTREKLGAALRSLLSWRRLSARGQPRDPAVVLFTSGSESLPKAVPLTHANLLTNMRDVTAGLNLRPDDRMIGMLPPFHSFGLNCALLLPLCYGLPTAYHANPTESAMLARLIAAYGITLLIGTPTFLNGILRAASGTALRSLRLAVSGAEKCPPAVFAALARSCPGAAVLEGYGITECSPVVSVNDARSPRPGTIGRVLPSFHYVIQDVDTGQRVEPGRPGMLLLRGPCVFAGYLAHSGPSPFVTFEGREWYRTGDLVAAAPDGVLTFVGRLKRFVKLGGEMISLPAIEEVLAQAFLRGDEDKPLLAVESTAHELNPELVLFAALEVDREAANRAIRQAGLSALHNLRHVLRVEAIPVLGTGKTDYRELRRRLADELKAQA
jgi:long-chain-fatty-acid--[acyl-carrier-protein] ligase